MIQELKTGRLTEPVSGRSWSGEKAASSVERGVARFQRLWPRRGERVFPPFGNRLEFFAELLAV